MIEKIIIDGNDGTGKTTRLVQLKRMFPNIKYEDRGIFSKMTLVDELFNRTGNYDEIQKKFYEDVQKDSSTLYIICRASSEVCQKRILERGDSIEEEFHTLDDLNKYNNRFDILVDIVKDLPNVMVVDTTRC